jgi:hypothetical protein
MPGFFMKTRAEDRGATGLSTVCGLSEVESFARVRDPFYLYGVKLE